LRQTATFVFESLAAILGIGAPALNGQDSIPFSAGGFRRQRRRAANSFGNPRIPDSLPHTTVRVSDNGMSQNKRPTSCMQFLGRRNTKTTLRHLQLIAFTDDECVHKTSDNVDQAKQLIESGFDYVTNIDEHKLFRKRK
jgi:hypothetical protein